MPEPSPDGVGAGERDTMPDRGVDLVKDQRLAGDRQRSWK